MITVREALDEARRLSETPERAAAAVRNLRAQVSESENRDPPTLWHRLSWGAQKMLLLLAKLVVPRSGAWK